MHFQSNNTKCHHVKHFPSCYSALRVAVVLNVIISLKHNATTTAVYCMNTMMSVTEMRSILNQRSNCGACVCPTLANLVAFMLLCYGCSICLLCCPASACPLSISFVLSSTSSVVQPEHLLHGCDTHLIVFCFDDCLLRLLTCTQLHTQTLTIRIYPTMSK